jgi:hypothetical protein
VADGRLEVEPLAAETYRTLFEQTQRSTVVASEQFSQNPRCNSMIKNSPEGDALRSVTYLQSQGSFVLLKRAKTPGVNDSLKCLKHPLSVPHYHRASKVLSAI